MLFAIGDVHGCADELRALLNRLPLGPDSTVVFLGDYIDRGPRSREVIETVLELGQHCNVVPLRGNHEEMLLEYLADPTSARAAAFIYNGGSATLASYANERGEVEIPAAHRAFFEQLRVMHETESHVFVHAGLPQVPLTQLDLARDEKVMLWTRGRFLTTDYDWGKVVVHGHTWSPKAEILPNRINVDTGCVFDQRLTAVALPGERLITVKRGGHPQHVVLRDATSRRAAMRFQGAVPVRIRRGETFFHFITVDYSELGMYMRAVGPAVDLDLAVGDRIIGVIGAEDDSKVRFAGTVVRRTVDDAGPHYGVRIHETRSSQAAT